ncbi:MAG TPA: type II secretion system protein [Micropepsaceae bacterium]|nr:type II secretion system protein [Micropepsaceae bacterium]
MPKNHTSQTSGFTLIEVTIALAIAALGLGVLMEAAGTGLGYSNIADQYIEATRLAQSHLSAVGVLTPLRPGTQSGDDGGGYSWRSRISEPVMHAGAGAGPTAQKPLGLYTVEVTLTWRGGMETRSVTLRSQRLAHIADGNG